MKKRYGFVSNSSSASFIIKKKNLTEQQIEMIKNHYDEGLRLQRENKQEDRYIYENWSNEEDEKTAKKWDEWLIEEKYDEIIVATRMTNFDMETYLIDMGLEQNVDFFEGDEDLCWDMKRKNKQ